MEEYRRAVPLFGLRYVDGGVRDPRQAALGAAAERAGLEVKGADVLYVYVAGWSPEIEDGLTSAGFNGNIQLVVHGCVWTTRRIQEAARAATVGTKIDRCRRLNEMTPPETPTKGRRVN